jgi:O-antigen biosynthesis protein
MSGSEKVSAIILVHNNVEMTRRCLESLANALDCVDHELILLDNGSTENISSLKDCGRLFRSMLILRSDENLSFSSGNNRCATNATGNLLLFLNNDVFLDPGSIDAMIPHFLEEPSAGIVGGMLLFPGRVTVQHAGMRQMLWGFPSNFGVGAQTDDPRVRQANELFALTGALQCVRKKAFQKVGGFDERYVWGYEDVDLCLKIRSAGFRVIYEPRVSGVHVESATLKVIQNRDSVGNYRIYRKAWDPILVPREQEYIRNLKQQGIKTLAVFGTGAAALGLSQILEDNGIRIVAYTTLKDIAARERILENPWFRLLRSRR